MRDFLLLPLANSGLSCQKQMNPAHTPPRQQWRGFLFQRTNHKQTTTDLCHATSSAPTSRSASTKAGTNGFCNFQSTSTETTTTTLDLITTSLSSCDTCSMRSFAHNLIFKNDPIPHQTNDKSRNADFRGQSEAHQPSRPGLPHEPRPI